MESHSDPTTTDQGDERRALLPCPFCGSSDLDPAKQAKQYVACNKCGAFGPSPDSSYPLMQWDLRRAAIHDAWQARSALAAPHPPVSAEAGKGVADAWLFTCKKPGTVMVYATIDPNDANHWPVDQWKSVVREDLFKRPSESVAVSGEVSDAQIAAALAAWFNDDGNGTFEARMRRAVLALAGSAKQAAALERMARLDDEMGIEP